MKISCKHTLPLLGIFFVRSWLVLHNGLESATAVFIDIEIRVKRAMSLRKDLPSKYTFQSRRHSRSACVCVPSDGVYTPFHDKLGSRKFASLWGCALSSPVRVPTVRVVRYVYIYLRPGPMYMYVRRTRFGKDMYSSLNPRTRRVL